MPEIEGTEGTEGKEGTEGTEGKATEGTTFTQADLDRIVQERLARQKAQFKDYDELKERASKYDEIEAANKTELEKANERATQAEAQAAAVEERAKKLLTDASITAAAAGKLADPSDAIALIDRGAIEYGEDGSPTNVAALVEALVESKPHLAAGGQRKVVDVDGGARGGTTTLDDAALMKLPDAEFLKVLGTPQ